MSKFVQNLEYERKNFQECAIESFSNTSCKRNQYEV